MEKVTTVKPLINPWIKYLSTSEEERNEFLGKLLSKGSLSRKRIDNCVVLAENENGFFNPSFSDGTMLYFVFESDARLFIAAKEKVITKNFSYARLCYGNCHH